MNNPIQPPSGLFLFDKPKGITSHDAVELLRRKLFIKKIGHTGTLDPMATGLLILLVGSATSVQASMQGAAKVYGGTILFGSETDTWDAEGKVTAEAPPPALDGKALEEAVKLFNGKIIQQVPPYSAIRLNGKHMYKLARQNVAMPEVKREVFVRWLSWAARPPALDFEIECSGGTYVRSIAHEMGRQLGSRAHLAALRRLSIGAFSVKDAVTASALAAMPAAEALALLRPVPGGAGA
ncbi:MAG: tRNA pseudouridine(55) synthase TruB [Elusimicrobia bacterium GWA2_61_42]|nr:MAG: tRNA pseudouridine(55) synthase TruB [Elusimicrobia bacterium GWA2_61_42]OGR74169.1 MAG: tRNA pseudouridine(55) synthase TruB [Elusimicrobia bacterium GWC2_61_25]